MKKILLSFAILGALGVTAQEVKTDNFYDRCAIATPNRDTLYIDYTAMGNLTFGVWESDTTSVKPVIIRKASVQAEVRKYARFEN